jgi:hydroxyacylglutathione hydrolase
MLGSLFRRPFQVSKAILGSWDTNCYLLNFATRSLLIDPAADAPKILSWLARSSPGKTLDIFLTHGHFDHFLAVPVLCRAFPSAKIFASASDLPLFRHPTLNVSQDAGSSASLSTLEQRIRSVSSGDSLVFDSECLAVLALPGHTPGSIGLYSVAAKCAFVGDTLLREAIGSTEFPLADHDVLMNSIREHIMTLPDDTIIYPGHGEQTTVGHERRENVFISGDQMEAKKRLAKIFAFMAMMNHEPGPADFLQHCIESLSPLRRVSQ